MENPRNSGHRFADSRPRVSGLLSSSVRMVFSGPANFIGELQVGRLECQSLSSLPFMFHESPMNIPWIFRDVPYYRRYDTNICPYLPSGYIRMHPPSKQFWWKLIFQPQYTPYMICLTGRHDATLVSHSEDLSYDMYVCTQYTPYIICIS